jgi:uncharacterized protein YggE
MRVRTLIASTAVAATVMAVSWVGGAGAASSDQAVRRDPRTITVTGTGMVSGTPDVLELTIGVETRAHSAGEALSRNSLLVRKVIEVLRDTGLSGDDIQTSNLSVSPYYDKDGEHIDGYAVSNLVTAKIKNIDKAGGVVDAATKVAGNEVVINGLYFSFGDNSQLVAQARAEAVKRARSQAEQLARAAGVELGDLLTMSEDSVPDGPVIQNERPKAASGDAAAPIEPGSQALTVQVSMVYEIH